MDISVIIVNYNTKDITKQCLDSIYKWTRDVRFEVIVVDNNSNDGSKEMLECYPNIKYIQSGANLGFGKANNLGYKHSSGKYVLLLNSDTYLLNNALKNFVSEFEHLPEKIGCIGAWLRSSDGSLNNSYSYIPNLKSSFFSILGIYLRLLGRKSKIKKVQEDITNSKEVEYVIGADICIRRNVIEKCGLFDPDFFMYYEDTEMQLRYNKAGYKFMIVSSPLIVHLECMSSKDVNKKYTYKNRKMFFNSYILFMKKRCTWFEYILFRIVFIFQFPIFLAPYYSFKEKVKMISLLFKPSEPDIRRL